jgi:hypothetical protein
VLLETVVESDQASLGDAPLDDEPETDAEHVAVAQARGCLKNNGGRGVPHNDAMRRLGLE